MPGERRDGRPCNLLGFKDATGNPRRGKDLARHVWVSGRERTWNHDGADAQGRADAGLLLLLYGRDPRRQFIPLQGGWLSTTP
ncbi:MAG: hypothetical protein M3071_18220 [Actinomycetota bacterium]|nr:hypothetical protein [Actinomycetota bacterium]